MHLQNRHRVGIGMLVLLLIAALAPVSAAQEQSTGPPGMFTDAIEGRVAGYEPPDHVARHRVVNVDVSLLFDSNGQARTRDALPEVGLNLFPDVGYTGLVTGVESNRWSTTWTGDLAGASGYFYLTVADDVFIAHIASPGGIFEVSWAGDGQYRVIEVIQSELEDHPPEGLIDLPDESLAPTGDLEPRASSSTIIDVLVVYSDDARAGEGSTAAMKARIALAMAETNTSYANAGVNTRLRLVHVREVSYAESGNLATDVNRLAAPNDGHLDQVHRIRNRYGADMVALIVEGSPYCGRAADIMATADSAFQVTRRPGCMTGNYSFGHEFGHLQGARHDAYVDPTTTPYTYGHGYVHPKTADLSERWRTVMAYNTRCEDWYGDPSGHPERYCTRLQYWSNPGKTFGGDRMGKRLAKNYKVLDVTAPTVANFRDRKIGADFRSTFNTNARHWSAVVGNWTLVQGKFLKSTGIAGTNVSMKRTNAYGDFTYEVRIRRAGCATCSNRLIVRGRPSVLSTTNHWVPSYIFQYANEGMYSVYQITNSGYNTLKGWTSHSAIKRGRWNTLKVVVVGSSLNFYINGTLVWSGTDSALNVGRVGFGFFRNETSTGNRFTIDWAKLTTTPTAGDAAPREAVVPGVEVPGGTIDESP